MKNVSNKSIHQEIFGFTSNSSFTPSSLIVHIFYEGHKFKKESLTCFNTSIHLCGPPRKPQLYTKLCIDRSQMKEKMYIGNFYQ